MAKASLRGSAMYLAGLMARGMGYPELASQALGKATAISPENPTFHCELGFARTKSHLLDEADASFRRALELKPDMAAAYSGLADTSRIRENVADAIIQYEKALSLDPDLPQAHSGLGIILRDQFKLAEAAHHFRRAVELEPSLVQANNYLEEIIAYQKEQKTKIDNLLKKLRNNSGTKEDYFQFISALYRAASAGMREWAIARAREWVDAKPGDEFAMYELLCLEGKISPPAPPEGYFESAFDGGAEMFDERLRALCYQGPDLIRRLIDRHGSAQRLDILDMGCGTGLCAVVLKPYARTLTGVDFSTKMLEIAEKRRLYDKLHKSDIVSFLRENPAAYDLIVASDVFCYFGDLSDVVCGMAGSLRPGGEVVFTVEHDKDNADSRWHLLPSGRFCHTDLYVRDKVKEAGLTLLAVESGLLRQEFGQNIDALVVLARKGP